MGAYQSRLLKGELRHVVLSMKMKVGLDESVQERRSEPRICRIMSIIKSITWDLIFNSGRTFDEYLPQARSRS